MYGLIASNLSPLYRPVWYVPDQGMDYSILDTYRVERVKWCLYEKLIIKYKKLYNIINYMYVASYSAVFFIKGDNSEITLWSQLHYINSLGNIIHNTVKFAFLLS